MTDLNVKLSVQIPGGSTIQSSRTITVGAHRKIDFSLPPGNGAEAGMKISFLPDKPDAGNSTTEAGNSTTETQKSNSEAGKINLLLIQSSFYSGEKEGGELRFSIGDNIKDQKLTEPLLLLGSEMIGVLAPPQTIIFVNTYPSSKSEQITEKDKDGKETQKTKTTDLTTENTAQITILIGLIAPDTTPSAAPAPTPSPA